MLMILGLCAVFEIISAYGTVGLSLGAAGVSVRRDHYPRSTQHHPTAAKLFTLWCIAPIVQNYIMHGHDKRSSSRFALTLLTICSDDEYVIFVRLACCD